MKDRGEKFYKRFGWGIKGFGIVFGTVLFALAVWSIYSQLSGGSHVQLP